MLPRRRGPEGGDRSLRAPLPRRHHPRRHPNRRTPFGSSKATKCRASSALVPGRDVRPRRVAPPSLTRRRERNPASQGGGNNSTRDLEESSENHTNIVEDYPVTGFLRIPKMTPL